MATNPFSRTATGFDLTQALAVPANDALLPSGMNDGLQALQQAVGQSLNQGSFSARHPIGAAILSALGGGVLGGIAGGMDDNVGAGRGAALGALMGGIQAPLMERQRRNTVAGKYLEIAPKLLEYQKSLEEMRKGRAGAQYLAEKGKQYGFKNDYLKSGGSALPLSDKMLELEADTMSAESENIKRLREQFAEAIASGGQAGRSINSQAGVSNAVQGAVNAPQASESILPAVPTGSDGITLEADPTVSKAMAPLQAGVTATQTPEPGSLGIPMRNTKILEKIIGEIGSNQRSGVTGAITAPGVLARAAMNNAQAKEILDKLPYEIKAIIAETAQRNAAASLDNRTNPNLRSGGGARNADMGPARLRMEQLKVIAGNAKTFGEEASRQAQQELLDMAGIEAPAPTPDANSNDGTWLQELFQSAFGSDKGRN